MNRAPTSVTGLSIAGVVIGLLSLVLAVITGTGTFGIYGFGLFGITGWLTFLMWPERTRFFMGRSATRAQVHHRGDKTHRRRRRPRAL